MRVVRGPFPCLPLNYPFPCAISTRQLSSTPEGSSSSNTRTRVTILRITQSHPFRNLPISSAHPRSPLLASAPHPGRLRIPRSPHLNFEMRLFTYHGVFAEHKSPRVTHKPEFSHLRIHPQPIQSTSLPFCQPISARNTSHPPH